MQMAPSSGIPIREIHVAVVGAAGVGKTTFIKRAYELKSTPGRYDVPSLTMVFERSPCIIKLVEADWTKIEFEKQPIHWPRMADGQWIPSIDGILLLYDVTNPVSINRVPEALDAFSKASLPVCLVSTKCDSLERQLNPNCIDQIGNIGVYEQIQTSLTERDSQKKCVAAILSMISKRNGWSPFRTFLARI